MKFGFYPKLALTGIRKNKRLYIPYILTAIGMIMMQYIITFLSQSKILRALPSGSATAQTMLGLGTWVILVFAAIFLFYTNSFLIRRRKKEFGLYNILGMGKFNIGRILFWESVIITVISLVVGLIAGIVLSKFAELAFMNMINVAIDFTFTIEWGAVRDTAIMFFVIFVLILFNSLYRIRLTKPIELLHSENVGEKPPKANWILGVLGIIMLGAAYYMAVSIKEPLAAIMMFFVAVILVIIATYILFVSGSVVMCRLLQKSKNFYYKSKNFVSVSSMAYRMKRNGAGLASICILGTMVLVMLASTACLYFGAEGSLASSYPRQIITSVRIETLENMNDDNIGIIRNDIVNTIKKSDVEAKNVLDYRYALVQGYLENGVLNTTIDESKINLGIYENLYYVYFVPLEDYNSVMGTNITLSDGEAMIYSRRNGYKYDTFTVRDTATFNVVGILDKCDINGDSAVNIMPAIFVIVPDFNNTIKPLEHLTTDGTAGYRVLSLYWYYGFNIDADEEKQIALSNEIRSSILDLSDNTDAEYMYTLSSSLAKNREDFYGTYGGLFFLGIMLSIVFVFAAVLIIYYKQISEGYEDQSRFEIMQKVGMTKKDIRKSINSQMLTVFLLPLVAAAMHLAFAFPMIEKLLMLFNILDTNLLILTTGITLVIFALFYALVYRITSNAYYNIVSGAKNE